VAERLTELRAGAVAQHQRHAAQHGRHRGHQYGAEAQQAGPADRFERRHAVIPLGHDGEVDQHDAVLLDDADQQHQADQAEVEVEEEQCRESASA
jgi:hypothetical protein